MRTIAVFITAYLAILDGKTLKLEDLAPKILEKNN
jgi:hypothetical protein